MQRVSETQLGVAGSIGGPSSEVSAEAGAGGGLAVAVDSSGLNPTSSVDTCWATSQGHLGSSGATQRLIRPPLEMTLPMSSGTPSCSEECVLRVPGTGAYQERWRVYLPKL